MPKSSGSVPWFQDEAKWKEADKKIDRLVRKNKAEAKNPKGSFDKIMPRAKDNSPSWTIKKDK